MRARGTYAHGVTVRRAIVTRRGRTGVLELLTQRCGERLRRRRLVRRAHRRRAQAHAIRILLRRVGTRATVEEILNRPR